MHREELVGIQTIWWVDYQLAVGFLTGSWKSNLDVWISNHLFGNPTTYLSWPRCSGGLYVFAEGIIRVSLVGCDHTRRLNKGTKKRFLGLSPKWGRGVIDLGISQKNVYSSLT